MTQPRNINLTGKAGSGKTAVAEMLQAKYGYNVFSWADPLKLILSMAYGTVDKAAI